MNGKIIAGLAATLACSALLADEIRNYRAEAVAMMKRDFKAKGIATTDRLHEDGVQAICNRSGDNPPKDIAARLEKDQLEGVKYPADGKLMGDWKSGQKIAESGRGMTWSDKPGEPSGGSCYNCHELAPQQTSFGTMGPSLRQFGKLRGYTAEVQKYAYERIYNSKAFAPCSAMPRFGTSGTLTEAQIKDLVAYLMDPESPVNK